MIATATQLQICTGVKAGVAELQKALPDCGISEFLAEADWDRFSFGSVEPDSVEPDSVEPESPILKLKNGGRYRIRTCDQRRVKPLR